MLVIPEPGSKPGRRVRWETRGRGMPGRRETRHRLESALSAGIRTPPPCLPPGSSKQRLASSPPLLPQQPGAWVLQSALAKALLSTSYQMGKRDGHAKPGWPFKSSLQTPASRKLARSSSAPLPSPFARRRVSQGAPGAAPCLRSARSLQSPRCYPARPATHSPRREQAWPRQRGGRRMDEMGNFFFR